MRTIATIGSLVALAAGAHAQHAILFAMDGDEIFFDNAEGLVNAGTLRPDEVGIFTPELGVSPSASIYLTADAQWVFIGDLDQDGRLVDASEDGPGADTNAIFVKRFTGAPTGHPGVREIYFSKEAADGLAATHEDGDVYRYAGQGMIEYFIREADILVGLGQPAGDIDLDAIAQDDGGNVYFSLDLTETVIIGGLSVSVEDGSILRFPASALTYDAAGNVTAVAADSAELLADEDDVDAMIAASGVMTSVGGTPSTSIDLTGLEMDPNGGMWTSPQTALMYPNLLFCWDGFSNDGAILSTGGGGSIALVNGVEIGSTVATTGRQIGMLPDSTGLGGLTGLAVIEERPVHLTAGGGGLAWSQAGGGAPQPIGYSGNGPLVVENYPVNLITSSTILYTEQQVSGATSDGVVVLFFDLGPVAVGSVLGSFTLPAFDHEVFGDGIGLTVLNVQTASANGHLRFVNTIPAMLVGSGINLAFQIFDFGTGQFGLPAGMQFL